MWTIYRENDACNKLYLLGNKKRTIKKKNTIDVAKYITSSKIQKNTKNYYFTLLSKFKEIL